MRSPSSREQLVKPDSLTPELVASPDSSASSWTESPPLSPLRLIFDAEKSDLDDDDIRLNPHSGEDFMSSSVLCDCTSIFPFHYQAIMSPWMCIVDIDDMGRAQYECESQHRSLDENLGHQCLENRLQHLSDNLTQEYHHSLGDRSRILPKIRDFRQKLCQGERRSNETRDDSAHQPGYFHLGMLIRDSTSHDNIACIFQQIGSVCFVIFSARLILIGRNLQLIVSTIRPVF